MKNSSNLKVIRFKYALKRFLLYWLYGIISAVFPFFFGILFGFPSVFLAASTLAIADAINLKIEIDGKTPLVFSRAHKITLFILALIMILYIFVLGVIENYK
ncbi:MAG: hypothetical protein AB8B68_05495 [Rickettsiaceae bacterium]